MLNSKVEREGFFENRFAKWGAIAALILAVYGQALWFDFAWDDRLFIIDNKEIKSLSNIPSFFGSSMVDLYRPLRTTLYAVTYSLFGLNPMLYHAFAILLHIAMSIAVLRLLETLGLGSRGAFFGALVFALHAVHIEKFIFITSGFDIPGDICLTIALVLYLEYRNGINGRSMYASLGMFALGLLFSETAMTFPFLVVLIELVLPLPPWKERREIKTFAVLLLSIVVVYMAVRTGVVGKVQRLHWTPDYARLYMTMFVVLVHYIGLLFFPYQLTARPPIEQFEHPVNSLTLISMLIIATLVILAWLVRKEKPFISLGILWSFVVLLPNMNIIPTQTLIAERYLYNPSVGFCIMIAALLQDGKRGREMVAAGFIVFLAVLSLLQTPNWKNNFVLWSNALEVNPKENFALYNVATHYYEQGDKENAKKYFRMISSPEMGFYMAQAHLAGFMLEEGDIGGAVTRLSGLLRIAPFEKEVNKKYIVAKCFEDKKGWEKDGEIVLKRLGNEFPFETMGDCYFLKGEFEKSYNVLQYARKLDPNKKSVNTKLSILEQEMAKGK